MTEIRKQEQTYKKPSTGSVIGGFVAGTVVSTLATVPSTAASIKIINKMAQISTLSDDEFNSVTKTIDKILKDSKLAEKGVEVLRFKSTPPKNLWENILGLLNPIAGTQQGRNAFFTYNNVVNIITKEVLIPKNIIGLPEREFSLPAFHEIGHAANNHLSKIGKALQKSRALSMVYLPFAISMIALSKIKKSPEQKPKGTMDKTTTFIENNAGKLTFLATLPMLIEEGMASIKGIKFAEKAGLPKELLAKVIKANKIAYLTYLGTALAASIGIYLGVKVKNAIAKPQPVD